MAICFKKPTGIPLLVFKEKIHKSFVLSCQLSNEDIVKQFYEKDVVIFYLSSSDIYENVLANHVVSLAIGNNVHEAKPFSYLEISNSIVINIENIPSKFCNKDSFEYLMKEFCLNQTYRGDNPKLSSSFIRAEIDTNENGCANTGKVWTSFIHHRVCRQGGKIGYCFDEKPLWSNSKNSMIFYVTGTPFCKACAKKGHAIEQCYIVKLNLCAPSEVVTPEIKQKAQSKARTLTLENGDQIYVSPNKNQIVRKKLTYEENLDSLSYSPINSSSASTSTTSSSSSRLSISSFQKESITITSPVKLKGMNSLEKNDYEKFFKSFDMKVWTYVLDQPDVDFIHEFICKSFSLSSNNKKKIKFINYVEKIYLNSEKRD